MNPQPRSGPATVSGSLTQAHAKIWRTVMRIPRGRVASYGQVAREAGLPGRARLVGQILHHLPVGLDLPWHRVINAAGRISLPGSAGRTQAALLEREGVALVRGRIDMKRYRWAPRHRGSLTPRRRSAGVRRGL